MTSFRHLVIKVSLLKGKGRRQKRKIVFIWFFGVPPACVNMFGGLFYSLALESIRMVTGPSLTNDTCMSAPKIPV